MLGLDPTNLPTRVRSIDAILWSTSSSGISMTYLHFSLSNKSLIEGKKYFPLGFTPKRVDHWRLMAFPLWSLPWIFPFSTTTSFPGSCYFSRGTPSFFFGPSESKSTREPSPIELVACNPRIQPVFEFEKPPAPACSLVMLGLNMKSCFPSSTMKKINSQPCPP